MDGEVLLDFSSSNGSSDNSSIETLISTTIFKSLRLFNDGVLNMPMVFCKGDNFKLSCQNGVLLSDALYKSFFLLTSDKTKYVFHAKSRFFSALVKGIELRGKMNQNVVDLSQNSKENIIVMSTMLVEKNISIIGNTSTKIIIVPPVMMVLSTPVHVKIEGIQFENISNTGMNTFFSYIPSSALSYEIPSWSFPEKQDSALSSVVLACHNSVVHAKNCSFKMDIGCCSKNVGVCVVEQASVAVFQNCSFETVMPSGFLSISPTIFQEMSQGPGVSVCVAPSWGRVAFKDCGGEEKVSGGCCLVVGK